MRKLLPYEHQLIEALGVTKEEYLNFVAIQRDYKDPKVGTALDVRNADGGATVAIVLTIVGTLFQVGAALLAPKPEIPDGGRRTRNRQQRFAPSFGFNSVQDLAKYGDPVNLIYTNNSQNPLGSVRANGSLVWSAIENFGSMQFMQLMVVIGAAKLKEINFQSTAFGQKDLSNFDIGSLFIFARPNGREGVPRFNEFIRRDQDTNVTLNDFFPKRLTPDSAPESRPACLSAFQGEKREAFSQAYSPTTTTSLGIFDVVPINVNVLTRNEKGRRKRANILIKLTAFGEDGTWKNNARDGIFEVGNQIEFIFTKTVDSNGDPVYDGSEAPGKTAIDMRRQMIEGFDFGSTYCLGSAKFRFQTFFGTNRNKNIEAGDVKIVFQCIERGAAPSESYDREEPKQSDEELKAQIENAVDILENDNSDLQIPDDRLSDERNIKQGFTITSQEPDFTIDYTGHDSVRWNPTLNLIDDNNLPLDTYTLPERSQLLPRSGSIAFSEEIKQDQIEDVPVIDVDSLRKSLRQQKNVLKN